ncbi:MAG TPA: hypothetical protein VLX09_21450 [Stellaceae bacterium]|nr:hypothetical protein [Stellaceae bacterium]
MNETVEGVHPSADPPPPAASLTAISIKVRSRKGEKPSLAATSPARKSGDLTRHLARQAAKTPPAVVSEPEEEGQAAPLPPFAVAGDAPEALITALDDSPVETAIEVPPAVVFPADTIAHEPIAEPVMELRETVEAIVAPAPEQAEFGIEYLEAPTETAVTPVAEITTTEADEAAPDTIFAPVEEPLPAEILELGADAIVPSVAETSTAEALEAEPYTFVAPVEDTTPFVPALSIVHSSGELSPVETPSASSTNAPETSPAPVEAAATEFPDIAAYWRSLCGELVYPAVSAVDRDFVSQRWPGTLMIAFACTPGYPNRHPSIGGVARLGTASATLQEAIDSGSYAVEWMIEVGRAALAAAAPLEELQRLPTHDGNIAFRLLALPLGARNAEPDTVLCHLAPATAAPRFGKRRNWLAA